MTDRNDAESDMNCGLTIDERGSLREKLRELPDTLPPRAVWDRIEQQGRAEGLLRRPVIGAHARWFAGSGIAAAVVLAVLNLPAGERAAGPTIADEAAYDPDSAGVLYDSINALMVQSQLLERDLRRLPGQPEIGRAETLATIDDLQNRIAAIDYRLNEPEGRLSPEQQEIFWRERVRLMDSLLRLRYAQAQRLSF